VSHVDDALALMTGLPAGDPVQPAADTVNGRIARRLHDYARIRTGRARVHKRSAPIEIRHVVYTDDDDE